jgi:hypothetical protein
VDIYTFSTIIITDLKAGFMSAIADYSAFLQGKTQLTDMAGFNPVWMPDFLFDFQVALVDWAIKKGRAAIFADCGLGKTPMQLVWAENVVRSTGEQVLILTPLAVSHQTIEEGAKFGIEVSRSLDGVPKGSITVTNYERLHYFNPADFAGVVCDESSILKSFDGIRRQAITEFMRKVPYRLLCTATAAPNDYVELGTSAEALGELGYIDMLNRFFSNKNNTSAVNDRGIWGHTEWRFKPHAEQPFWRWVCSWARAIRSPSDLGFDDNGFLLPALDVVPQVISAKAPKPGMLFDITAIGLQEERELRRRTIKERCEASASLINNSDPAVLWCHLNDEGDLLTRLVPDAIQVSGKDSDESKETKLRAFQQGNARVLVIKPKIGAFGLNWQHCAHITYFPSHSYEQYYQAVRRCWRFGQTQPVRVDLISTDADDRIVENLQRKTEAASQMFSSLVAEMNHSLSIARSRNGYSHAVEVPGWL